MNRIIFFLVLCCVNTALAQERNYESMMTSITFRGKSLILDSKKNPDGTYTDQYRDSEGNPLTEMERNFVDGHNKLTNRAGESNYEDDFRNAVEGSKNTPFMLFLMCSENPEFQAWAGISFEQVRDIRLAQWGETINDYPPDEIIDISVRAGQTDDEAALKELSAEMQLFQMEYIERQLKPIMESLSPQQVQKLWELNWAMNGDSAGIKINMEPVAINFASYNALNLNPEQQKKLEGIKKEFLQTAFDAMKAAPSEKERETALWKKSQEIMKAFQTKIKTTVLTDAQRKKMEQLQADKPKFLMAAAAPPKEEKDTEWMKSWKPGDPVPEGMLPPLPPSRFPIR